MSAWAVHGQCTGRQVDRQVGLAPYSPATTIDDGFSTFTVRAFDLFITETKIL